MVSDPKTSEFRALGLKDLQEQGFGTPGTPVGGTSDGEGNVDPIYWGSYYKDTHEKEHPSPPPKKSNIYIYIYRNNQRCWRVWFCKKGFLSPRPSTT